jgi:DNA-binding response OmpR family regulator
MGKNHPIQMLSIDDRSVTTELDSAGYRKMGVVVRGAATYDEAERLMEQAPIDVLVINLDYRKVDAVQVIKHLRSTDKFSKLPIVVTSVQAGARSKSGAIEAGADLFVEQPVPRHYFIEKLKSLLSHKTRGETRVGTGGDARFVLDGREVSCELGDVSSGGVLLQGDLSLDPGTTLNMVLMLPGMKKTIEVNGTVVRKVTKPVTGIGFRIDSFKGDGKKRLERYVAVNAESDSPMVYYL